MGLRHALFPAENVTSVTEDRTAVDAALAEALEAEAEHRQLLRRARALGLDVDLERLRRPRPDSGSE